MQEFFQIYSVASFNNERGQITLHPLVSVLDQSNSCPIKQTRYLSELYIVFLKDSKCEELKYGRNQYDYEESSLLFIAPGQVFGFENKLKMIQPSGWALCFHPDLIRGTYLAKSIRSFGFFTYDSNEALHVSVKECDELLSCLHKIQQEITQSLDKHSRTIVVNNIELFLNYCSRFYDRQFVTREFVNKDILTKFEELVDNYFNLNKSKEYGLPSVSYFAKELHLSPKYFGDLIKKETGYSAQDFIHLKLIDASKEKVFNTSKTISEIAYDLGFKHPSHFTRFFKKKLGKSPIEYRTLN
jgi:AraC family transcriptional activator of pobA